jgi:hypothetical protein
MPFQRFPPPQRCQRLNVRPHSITVTATQENRYDEFRELEHTARGYLLRPDTIPSAPSLDAWFLQFQLWHFPSFTEHRSWAVYQRRERGSRLEHTMLRQTTWDYATDSRRLIDPLLGVSQGFHTSPTIEIRDRPISPEAFDSRIARLRDISFPAFYGRPGGIDGEFFGMAFPPPASVVWWWCDGPASWRTLIDWAAEMRHWLTSIAELPPQSQNNIPPKPSLP